MTITFLGTGTSTGVPQVGCSCAVCTSADPRDRRLRTSALVKTDGGTRILIDCGPDFRQQMLATDFQPLDAVLITHEHYDHVGGLDDLRPFSVFGDVDVYAEEFCAAHLEKRIPYCFAENPYPGVPRIRLRRIQPGVPFRVGDADVLPLRVMHGKLPILGFRIGPLAYITDMTALPAEELPQLSGIRQLVVNALRHEPHATHQTIDEALAFSRQVGSPPTWLIHMGHSAGLHRDSLSFLPSHVAFAYDGLRVRF